MLTNTDIGRIEQSERRFVRLKHIYIDMAGGDMIAGAVLSEIAYWSLVPKKTGESRLRKIKGQEHLWLACPRKSWWERSRIAPRQFDRAVARLVKLGLIQVERFQYRGQETVHARLVADVFNQVYNANLEGLLTPPKLKNVTASVKRGVSLISEGVSPNGYTPSPNGDTDSPIGEPLDLRVPSRTPSSSNPNGCAAPPAAADFGLLVDDYPLTSAVIPQEELSPIGEIDDWLADDLPVQPVTESEPTPVQETPAPEPTKPTELDWAGREMCQLAVRYYFGLQEPKRPSEFSHIQKLVNFFTGKIKGKGKADEWFTHQQSEDPLAAYEIVGLRIWFKGKFEDATLPQKPSTLADYIPQFRLAENYRRCCDTGAKRLLEMRKAMQPAVVEPEPVLSHAAPPAPPVEEDPISPEFDFLPGETLAEYRARLFPRLLANVRGVSA